MKCKKWSNKHDSGFWPGAPKNNGISEKPKKQAEELQARHLNGLGSNQFLAFFFQVSHRHNLQRAPFIQLSSECSLQFTSCCFEIVPWHRFPFWREGISFSLNSPDKPEEKWPSSQLVHGAQIVLKARSTCPIRVSAIITRIAPRNPCLDRKRPTKDNWQTITRKERSSRTRR